MYIDRKIVPFYSVKIKSNPGSELKLTSARENYLKFYQNSSSIGLLSSDLIICKGCISLQCHKMYIAHIIQFHLRFKKLKHTMF